MALTAWIDESMDWENPNPLEAKYWEALRVATLERYIAVNRSGWFEYYLKQPFWDEAFTPNLYHQEWLVNKLQEQIIALLPYYRNHNIDFPLDNWNVTQWTTDSMFKTVSADSILRVEKHRPVESATGLIKQLFAILNQMRSFEWTPSSKQQEFKEVKIEHASDFDDDWDTLSDEYDSMAWQPWTSGFEHPVSLSEAYLHSVDGLSFIIRNYRTTYKVGDVFWPIGSIVSFYIKLISQYHSVYPHFWPEFDGGVANFQNLQYHRLDFSVLASLPYSFMVEFTKAPKPINRSPEVEYSSGYGIQGPVDLYGPSQRCVVSPNFMFRNYDLPEVV